MLCNTHSAPWPQFKVVILFMQLKRVTWNRSLRIRLTVRHMTWDGQTRVGGFVCIWAKMSEKTDGHGQSLRSSDPNIRYNPSFPLYLWPDELFVRDQHFLPVGWPWTDLETWPEIFDFMCLDVGMFLNSPTNHCYFIPDCSHWSEPKIRWLDWLGIAPVPAVSESRFRNVR